MNHDEDYWSDFREGDEFKAYCETLYSALTDEFQTYRAVREKAGLSQRRFCEALDYLEGECRLVRKFIGSFELIARGTGEIKELKLEYSRWTPLDKDAESVVA